MSLHYTRSTQSAAKHCKKCGRQTQHRVDKGRIGPCLECIAKAERDHASKSKREESKQELLF